MAKVPCPQCKGCGVVALAQHAPKTAAALDLLRERRTLKALIAARHLDTSIENAHGLLNMLVAWGFADTFKSKGGRVWTIKTDSPALATEAAPTV